MKRRKELEVAPLTGKMVRSMMLVGDLSMRVCGAVKVLKSLVWAYRMRMLEGEPVWRESEVGY